MSRIKKILKKLSAESLDFFLITDPANVRYVLGRGDLFDTHFGGAILLSKGQQILMTDFRYVELAKKASLDLEIKVIEKNLIKDVAETVSNGIIGIEADHLRTSVFLNLKQELGERVIPKSNIVQDLREIKDEDELALIKKAAAIGDEVFKEIVIRIKEGVSERELATEIDFMLRNKGASGVSFDPIVASGPNSAMPHATITDRAFKDGDLIKLDFGCVYKGFCSDMTRTVVLGRAEERQKNIYELVRRAQSLVLDRVSVGMSGQEADGLARDLFLENDVAENFGHGLGHGVGLEVHERPVLGQKSKMLLKANSVFTVEPGLYFSGFGGVRIEDMIVLREDGASILTHSPKELIEIK